MIDLSDLQKQLIWRSTEIGSLLLAIATISGGYVDPMFQQVIAVLVIFTASVSLLNEVN